MKKFLFLILINSTIFSCTGIRKKEAAQNAGKGTIIDHKIASKTDAGVDEMTLDKTIIKVIKAYQEKDEQTLNGLIYEDFGLAILFARGAFNNVSITEEISFTAPIPEYLPYATSFETDYQITENLLPEFSCGTEKWNQPPGIYIDTKIKDKSLSETAKMENEILGDGHWSEQAIKRFEEIEDISHKVISIGKNNETFIFYVGHIDGIWYLTAIDRFEVCSV